MSLQACPNCGRPVPSFARFLFVDPLRTKTRCPSCQAELSFTLVHRFLALAAGIVLLACFALGYILRRRLQIFPEIPFIVAVAVILAFFLLIKGINYFLGSWQVKDASPPSIESKVQKPALAIVVVLWLCTGVASYGAIRDIFIVRGEGWWTSVLLVFFLAYVAVDRTRKYLRVPKTP